MSYTVKQKGKNMIITHFIEKIFGLKAKRTSVFYINGSQTLPPPLSPEEENEILQRLASEPQLKGVLIERNLRLVVYIAKKFESTGIGIEDLISIGTIGLIKSVNTYNVEKNIKLATYSSRCIENEILMYIRKNNASRNEMSLDEPLNVDHDGNELLVCDVIGSDTDTVSGGIEQDEERDMINKMVNSLAPREREIIRLRFGLDGKKELTQKETADALGISQSYISRLEKKIIKKLKRELESTL